MKLAASFPDELQVSLSAELNWSAGFALFNDLSRSAERRDEKKSANISELSLNRATPYNYPSDGFLYREIQLDWKKLNIEK